MTGHTLFTDGLLAEIFQVSLSCKANARRLVHSPRYNFIIPLSLVDRRDWHNIWGKWLLARNPDRSWWHRHTSLKLFLTAIHGSMDNRPPVSHHYHTYHEPIDVTDFGQMAFGWEPGQELVESSPSFKAFLSTVDLSDKNNRSYYFSPSIVQCSPADLGPI